MLKKDVILWNREETSFIRASELSGVKYYKDSKRVEIPGVGSELDISYVVWGFKIEAPKNQGFFFGAYTTPEEAKRVVRSLSEVIAKGL